MQRHHVMQQHDLPPIPYILNPKTPIFLQVEPQAELVEQLVGMGFSANGSRRAAVATRVPPSNLISTA